MRRFFEPASAPAWLKPVLSSIRAALGDVWDVPLRPFRAAASAFPPAADHDGGLAYDETVERPAFSDGSSWITLAAYDADVAAIAALSTTGLIARTGAGTTATRTITGTANQVTVTNGDGVSGAPTLSLPSAVTLPGSLVVTTTISATDIISTGGASAGVSFAQRDGGGSFIAYMSGSTFRLYSGSDLVTFDTGGNASFGIGAAATTLTFGNSTASTRIISFSDGFHYYDAGGHSFRSASGAATYASMTSSALNMGSGVALQANGTQVVTTRQAAVADATGAGDVVAQLNALLARLRTHGLIAS